MPLVLEVAFFGYTPEDATSFLYRLGADLTQSFLKKYHRLLVPAFYFVLFACLIFFGWLMSDGCFVPFGCMCKCVSGELVVRSSYATFIVPAVLLCGMGLYDVVRALRSFSKNRGRVPGVAQKAWNAVVWSPIPILMGLFFLYVLPHISYSMRRDACLIKIDDKNHWKIGVGVTGETGGGDSVPRKTAFDRRCLKFVAPYDFEFPSLPKDLSNERNGIYVSLDHVKQCCCSLKAKKQFISARNFPFDASVLLFAVATGTVDLSRSGSTLRTWMSVN